MTSKQLKFLQLFSSIVRDKDPTSGACANKIFPELLELDYALATTAWDYMCANFEQLLSSNASAATAVGGVILELFYAKNQQKCVKTIYDNFTIRKAIYQYAPKLDNCCAQTIIVDTLLANKTQDADEIFKCLIKNQNISFGAALKSIMERLFIEILKKSDTKKIELNRKLSALLLSYISKIKTDERAMLEQRIRETL